MKTIYQLKHEISLFNGKKLTEYNVKVLYKLRTQLDIRKEDYNTIKDFFEGDEFTKETLMKMLER